MSYERLLAPLDGFRAVVDAIRGRGRQGPQRHDPVQARGVRRRRGDDRARAARRRGQHAEARRRRLAWPTTPTGSAWCATSRSNLGVDLRGRTVAILGAGGAVRGIVKPLLDAGAASITVTNRTMAKAEAIAAQFSRYGRVEAVAPERVRRPAARRRRQRDEPRDGRHRAGRRVSVRRHDLRARRVRVRPDLLGRPDAVHALGAGPRRGARVATAWACWSSRRRRASRCGAACVRTRRPCSRCCVRARRARR